ncbi:tyrosine-type recombinase/integrase [Acetobacter senegalensis]
MASIIKRGRSWRAMIVRKGQRASATFDTRAEAEEWAVRAEASILSGVSVKAVTPMAGNQTVADLFRRYADEVSPLRRGERWEQIRLAAFCRSSRFAVPLSLFSAVDMAAWRDDRLCEVAASTINRDLNLMSAVFTHAIKEWRAPLQSNPVSDIKRPRNPKCRTRRVSQKERNAIADYLGWDAASTPVTSREWVAFAFFLALETAMRKGELLSLTWGDTHLQRNYVHLSSTKNGEERDVPLSSAAKALFLLACPGQSTRHVIPITSGYLDTTFRRATRALGIKDLHFHDARREAATQLSKRLSNVLELSAVTGHKSLDLLKVYYRPDPSDLASKLG